MKWWLISGRFFSVFVLLNHRQRCMSSSGENGRWSPRFCTQFHDWELGVTEFFQKLQACSVRREESDSLEWKGSKSGKFSVKFFYLSLVQGRWVAVDSLYFVAPCYGRLSVFFHIYIYNYNFSLPIKKKQGNIKCILPIKSPR